MPNASTLTREEGLKVLLVGAVGSGKSYTASTAPTPGFVFDLGGEILSYGGKNWDYEYFKLTSSGWTEFNNIMKSIATQTYTSSDPVNAKGIKLGDGTKYETIVLDNTTALYEAAMAYCMQIVPTYDEVGGPKFNVHYKMVAQLMKTAIRQFTSLPAKNKIVISHTTSIKNEEGNVIGVEPYLGGKNAEVLPGFFDYILYTRSQQVEGKVQYKLQTRTFGMLKARVRSSSLERRLPDYIDNNWDAITQKT